MFEQTFKNIDDVLWKEAGCTTELDYTEQTSWILFLKYLDDLEQGRVMEAELVGKPYAFIIDADHKWSKWAAPKKGDGTFDHDNALTGDDRRWCTCWAAVRRPQLSNCYAMRGWHRTDFGRPAASIRFRTATPIEASACWAAKPRARSRGPMSAL